MVLIDRRIMAGGAALLAAGIIITAYLGAIVPVGTSGMTDEEAFDLELAQQENRDYTTLSSMLIAVGFLLVLISFGARRRRGGKKSLKKKETPRL